MAMLTNEIEKRILKLRVFRQLFLVVLKKTGCPVKAFRLIKEMKEKYKSTLGQNLMNKVVKVDGRYFWRLSAPGFPSAASVRIHENEIARFFPSDQKRGLHTIIFAITKKCTLNCEHCFEWDNLAKDDTLHTSDLIKVVRKFQDYGTTQFMFTGGEPVIRLDDICEILNNVENNSDFWIFTSGIGLNLERAQKLKKNGLTGVLVSIDHYIEDEHNKFRGSDKVFQAAIQAVANANKAGLVSALSLCAHKDIVTKEHIEAYMNFAKELGVSFVQILDPRETGRYKGKDVELNSAQIEVLEDAYIEYNSLKEYRSYPIVNYLGYHQRRTGCFGGGDRFFYIDTDGDAHLCPYCRGKIGSAIELSAEELMSKMQKGKCHAFENAEGV
jgi:MoaA/NifB/PqqE/SkfB family radical SAM enzyme